MNMHVGHKKEDATLGEPFIMRAIRNIHLYCPCILIRVFLIAQWLR